MKENKSKTSRWLIAFAIVLLSLFFSKNASAAWYDSNWLYRQKISILPSLTDSDLNNFPYMVKITDPANPVFASALGNGDDILFTESNGTTKLDHELEVFDSSVGNESLVAWVRIPSLSASANTEIYMYYGYSGASNQENATGVWDSHYEGVWHLAEEASGTGTADLYKDSTLIPNHGDDYISATGQEGQIGNGQQFDGSDDYIDVSVIDPHTYDDFTISAWYKSADAAVSDDEYIFAHKKDSVPQDQILFGPTDDAGQIDNLRLLIEISGAGNRYYYGSSDIVDQQWHYVVAVRDGTRIRLYVDGIEELDTGDQDSGVSFTIDATEGPFFGDDPGDTEQVDGNLDEVRISDFPRNEDWIEASFRNQDSPDTYQALSTEQTTPDITIDCDFSDWTNGSGTEFLVDDQGGNDDWNNPQKLDITRLGVASNLSDTFYVLYGYDETPPNGTAAIQIDTDLNDNIDFALAVDVDVGGSTVQLYSCDNTLAYGCGNATLSKTYSTFSDYCVGTAAGPWNTDTFVEVAIPYADLGSFVGGAQILTSLISYNAGFWQNPKDSIFNDYYDRILYDTTDGTGQIIDDAGSPMVTGTVYADEGTTPVGSGKTVRLLVNGVDAGSDTTNANGDYLIIAKIGPNDAILVYIDDDATYQGNTVTVHDGVQVGGLDIYADHVIARHDNGGALSNSDMATAKGAYSDSDILFSVAGGALTVSGTNTELYVPTVHRFTPGRQVSTPQMKSLGRTNCGGNRIDINGTLTISGQFLASSLGISIAGDFINNGATFGHNSGRIVMDGTAQSISGSTDFYRFSKSVLAADTLTVEAGSTQTFANSVTLQGASGELLSMRSSSFGSRWNFTVNAGATKSISYVDVQDSDASGSDSTHKPINPSNSFNSGNTIDWFPGAPLLEQIHYRWRNDDGTENGDWWDSNYGYRRKVLFGTSHSILPLGFTVSATMDTRPSTTNVALTSGNDVRLVWQPSGGGAVELDRIGDTWNNASTSIEFRLQSQIPANAEEDGDGSYYIYYGYGSAGIPPTDEKNVYYFADFFNRGTIATVGNGWTEWEAGASYANITGNTLHEGGANTGPADSGIKQDFPLGAITSDFTVSWDWTVPVNSEGIWTVYTHIGNSMDNASRTTGVAFGLYAGEGSHFTPNNTYNIDSDLSGAGQLEYNINGTHSFQLEVNYAAKTFDYWRGGVERATNVAFFSSGTSLSQIRMANDQYASGQPDFVLDNLKIVLNVSNNPEEALDTEQNYAGSGSGASFALDEHFKYENLQKGGSNHIRLRFLVSNEGTGSESVAYELQVAEVSTSDGSECATATYYAVNDAVNELQWDLYPTINISAGGTDTTSNIGDGIDDALPDPGGGSFVSGRLVDDDDQTASINLDQNEFTEIEFSVQANNNATDGDEFCFRLGRSGGTALDSYDTYAYGLVNIGLGPTAVGLVSFTATGAGNDVKVDWLTGHEINNLGFNIYRAQSPGGPYQKINKGMIPGLDYSALGKAYSFTDTDVTPGTLYYYKLEDIDVSGKHTFHGPVCVDWDADGLPDDWEIAHGLNPWVNDADIDSDGDGLTNREEYELGFDPFNPDSDGDGILDGEEAGIVEQPDKDGSRVLMHGVEVIAEDESGITLELITEAFYTETLTVNGDEFERLRIDEYIHGYTAVIGEPEMPLKGILIDLPEGQVGSLRIVETEVQTHSGYQIYPLPAPIVDAEGPATAVGERFVQDEGAYTADAFYPSDVAGLAEVYTFRDQKKQQLIFYPLSFNPSSGDLRHYRRIRVRIDYVNDLWAMKTEIAPTPWKMPGTDHSLSAQISSVGSMAIAFGASPLIVNPLAPSLSSLGVILSAVWAPPADFGASAYKVLTEEAGIYRIYRTDLALDDDLSDIRLYHLGQEVAIYIYDQDSDDYLDATDDYIEFYAAPVPAAYSKYARYNVYWLVTSGGTGSPKRMLNVDGTPAAGALATDHSYLQHSEDDAIYRGDAPGEDSLDRWYYAQFVLGTGFTFTPDPVPAHFALPVFNSQAAGALTVSLWGYADTDHDLEVWVNGVYQDTLYWSGIAYNEAVIDAVDVKDSVINQTAQAGGADTITLAAAASVVDDAYNEMLIEITAGKGAGQVRKIIDYIGATKVATVETNWGAQPDATSVYRIDTAVTLYCDNGDDAFVVDYFELTYDRGFSAANDHLQFTHDSGYRYLVDAFSSNDLLIFDISDPSNVAYIENAVVSGSDSYDVTFEPPVNPGATETYLIIKTTDYKTPISISEDQASDLADTDHRIDYIIITHKDIGWDGGGAPYGWLDDLVNLREDSGLSVKTVDVADIYDEFSYGLYSPVAIRDFLAYAYANWQSPAPQYVILVGDGSFDYKDNLNIGTINYVPGYMVDTAYMGEAITDEYFVRISGGDAIADMYIGRLPAASEADAQAMVAKIKNYEETIHAKDWRQNVLLLADDQNEAYEAVFEAMNEEMPQQFCRLR